MKDTIGVVGLGKMGSNIAINLIGKGYRVIAFNRSPGPLEQVAGKGAVKAKSLEDLASQLPKPRIIWLMLTASDATINAAKEISRYCEEGDIIIDGSNSYYKESKALYEELKKKGISFLDAGCSGGPSGALKGMCIMVGGDRASFNKTEAIFKDLSVKNGCMYTGESGSGHFAKMVHNAIEYGMMQAVGEGLELIEKGPYKEIEASRLCSLWNNGSVIRGYLIELAARALEKDPHLSNIVPYVEDKGEGRYSVQTALEYDVPFIAITTALYERFNSRSEGRFNYKVLAALRHEFGGHEVKTAEK